MKLFLENASSDLTEYIQSHSADILKSTSVSGVDFQYDDTGLGRWNQLVLASQGGRLYSDTPNKNSPLYAGALPKNAREVDVLIADLVYTKLQYDFYKKLGATYIGRVQLDPRNLLVLDHKKKPDQRHDVYLSEPLNALLSASPADWWGSLGIVSAGTPAKLERFVNSFLDAIPMVISPKVTNILKFAGRDYVHLNEPKFKDNGKPDVHYGLDMRGRTNDLSKRLAEEESARVREIQENDENRKPALEVSAELAQ